MILLNVPFNARIQCHCEHDDVSSTFWNLLNFDFESKFVEVAQLTQKWPLILVDNLSRGTVVPLNFMQRVARISSSRQHRDYNRISICMSALDVTEVGKMYLRNIYRKFLLRVTWNWVVTTLSTSAQIIHPSGATVDCALIYQYYFTLAAMKQNGWLVAVHRG